MRKLKKLMALALTLAFALTMGTVSTFAASVEINTDSTDTHVYKVYQIFTGDLSGTTLSNLKYGANYGETGTAVPKAEQEAITDATAFAKDLVNNHKLTGDPVATLNSGNGFKKTDLVDGYYLVVDEGPLAETGDAYSAYIVQVSGDTSIAPKKDTTSGDKEITTDTLGKTTTTVNGKVDNVSIGDTVNFKITGNIPSHASDYDYYYYIIGDTLSEGLTFGGANSVVVKVGGTTLSEGTDYRVYTGDDADGKTFQVALLNAKANAGKSVEVTYSATLNEKAKIGEEANTNTMSIEYSNNPNQNYDGTQDEDHPGKPDKDKDVPTGKTPEVTTETYTTAIQIKKVDENNQILTGAEFTLTGDSVQIVLVTEEKYVEATDGTYYKLTDGTYTDQAPVTENTMKPAEAGADAGYVVAESDYAGSDTVTVGGTVYRPYVAETDSGKDVFVLVEANADQYASTTTKYKKTTEFTQKDSTSGTAVSAEVDENGIVVFKGLGAGEYTITETKTPDGYNTIDPLTVDVAFSATGSPHWSTTSDDATYNASTGTFELTIENQKGANLPTTGGIGTTLFYIFGAILVVGCGIVLVSRKRMENK